MGLCLADRIKRAQEGVAKLEVEQTSDREKIVSLLLSQSASNGVLEALFGVAGTPTIAAQFNRAVELFAQTITDESTMMEIADIYPAWSGDSKTYKTGTILSYGVNADGETQLYTVLQDHSSQADWTPDTATSLYKKVGFTDDEVAIWTQPLGATDAYMTGDVVSHNDNIWVSTIDNNVWEPGVVEYWVLKDE